jgi:hypothetical protein
MVSRHHNIFRGNVIAAIAIFAVHSWFFGHYIRHVDQALQASWEWPIPGLTFYGVYAAAIFIGLCHWPLFAAITGRNIQPSPVREPLPNPFPVGGATWGPPFSCQRKINWR